LIQEIAGGEILAGLIDVYPRPWHPRDLGLSRSEITRIMGAEIPGEEVECILRGLGFKIEPGDGESWRVSVPSFRVDVSREVDLVEEVARHVGYDRLPARVRPAPPRVERDATRDKVIITSSQLVGSGFHEIIAPSMIDPEECERFSASLPVVLANPLSQDASAMRSSAVPSMLRAIRWNLDRDTNDVKLFELGKIYHLSAKGVPQERRVLTLGATGHRRPASVFDSEAPLDFFDLKGDLETIFGAFDVPALDFAPSGAPYLQQGRSGRMSAQGVELAVFGLIHEDLMREYKLRQEVWVAEIDFERLLDFPLRSRKFQPISKFPTVERDFSLVVPDELPYVHISSAIAGLALEEICAFRPVDRFRGGTIPPRHYSLLLRVTFESQTHTLTSNEVGGLSQRLLTALEGLGVRLRG
jgi:phenylalanyl-tRNA synthetase beta chain